MEFKYKKIKNIGIIDNNLFYILYDLIKFVEEKQNLKINLENF